ITGKRNASYLGILLEYSSDETHVRQSKIVPLHETRRAGEVKLGLIGAGNFAKSVLLPRLAKASQVSLVGIATATGRNAKLIGKQYGFGFCTTDYRELLNNDEINTVLIATRHDTHALMTAEALRARKTVYVEKPLAISEEELNEVVEAAAQSGGRILVGYNRRFSSLSNKLKIFFKGIDSLAITYRVNAGEIPKESWIRQAESGGRILGEVCHFVDYLQFLTDAEPVEVFAYTIAENVDTVSIIVKLSDGSVG